MIEIMKQFFILFLLLILNFELQTLNTFAQQGERDLIQFSGVVVTGDSLSPVPFVNIIIKNSFRGTISDYFGYFSFVAQEYDTIVFSSVGFKKGRFVIPDSLSTNRYSLIQLLIKDTFLLQETIIYPWPTIEQFKQAFMNLNIPDDDLERAKNNLVIAELKERAEATGMDGSMNFTNYMQQQNSKLYYAGQYPPNNLLNPLAWAQFIQAWRNGDFKRKK